MIHPPPKHNPALCACTRLQLLEHGSPERAALAASMLPTLTALAAVTVTYCIGAGPLGADGEQAACDAPDPTAGCPVLCPCGERLAAPGGVCAECHADRE